MEENKTELKLIQMSEIETEEVSWLWFPFIPYGKLTIIQGDPGDGKTTMVLNLAAKLSRGESLNDGMNCSEPVNIIYQTAEDGLADTVKPRLEEAGADCSRISVIDESDKSLSMADERIEEALIATKAKLNTMVNHEIYSKSKTAPTEEEREKSRQEYLDRVGIHPDFRW